MRADAALRQAIARLAAAGVADPPGDGRRLLAHALGVGADRLTLHLGDQMDGPGERAFAAMIAARAARRPVSQIIGARLFFGHRFAVTGDVLDPRPETELLVLTAIEAPFGRLLDLGTGSGCILLSCLMAKPGATGVGCDVSDAALAVAETNAGALGLAGRAAFCRSDWFSAISGRFDLIVSNPPYVAADEMAALAPEVRDWEPHLALTPGGDGLGAYRAIAAGAGPHLAAGGRVIVEIGPTQGVAVAALFTAAGFAEVTLRRDLDGRDRVVLARM